MRTTRPVSGPNAQFELFGKAPEAVAARQVNSAVESGRRFVDGNRAALFINTSIGTVHLEQYLRDLKEHAALKASCLLDEQDWRVFESRYAASGRAPYAPRAMMGLILYAVMKGEHSLRELERLARLDLGCMRVSGGIMPDHANIGRFIVMHEASLAAGQVLHRKAHTAASAATRENVVYSYRSCAGCELREHCTTALARRITRYPQDTQREALRR